MSDADFTVKGRFTLVNEAGKELSVLSNQVNNTTKSFQQAGPQIQNSFGNALKGLETQIKSTGNILTNTFSNLFPNISSKISSSLSGAKSAIGSFSSAVQTMLSEVTKMGQGVYDKIGFIGTAMVALFTNKLKSAIQDATEVFKKFDDQMRKVAAVTESTGETFDTLTAKAREMGATTSYTAQDAAEAMTMLGQAGFDANEIMSAIPNTLNLARASMTELAVTADIMSNIMNGFQIAAEDTARVSDVLAKAANATNTDVTQLGNAMKYVAPLAYQMGWSLEETASAAGLLSNAGIKSSMAGTVLRNAISRLLSPTEKATNILASYGLSLDAVSPKTHNFAQIIDTLTQSGVSAADIMTVFGMRAGPGILAMMNIGTGAIRSMNQALYESEGYAKEAADMMDAGWGGAVRHLNDAIESLKLSFGEAFATILTPVVNAISVLGVAISRLPSPIIYLASAMALAAVAAGTLLTSLAALKFIVPILGAGMEVLTMGSVKIAMGLAKLSSVGGAVGTVFSGITSVIATLAPHLTLIVVGVTAVIAIFYELEKKTQLLSKSWETLQDLWTIGTYYLKKAFDGLKSAVSDAIDGILESLHELAENTWIGRFVDGVVSAYDTIAQAIGKWRGSIHESAEAIREDQEKQAESSSNVQKQIENANNGIITSYQTVDEATGQSYASMIENASDYAEGVTEANGQIITSNGELVTSTGEVVTALGGVKTALSDLTQTDISSINPGAASDLSFEALSKGIELVDGSMLILNKDGQLVIETLDGVITKLSELHSASLTTESGENITVLGGGEGTYNSSNGGTPKKISLEDAKRNNEEDMSTANRWAAMTGQSVIELNPDGTVPNPNTRRSYNYTVEEANDTVLGTSGRPKTTISLAEAAQRSEQFSKGTRQAGSGKTALSEEYLKRVNQKSIMERLNEKYDSVMKKILPAKTEKPSQYDAMFPNGIQGWLNGITGAKSGKATEASFDFTGIFKNIDTLKEKVSELDSLSLGGLKTTFGDIKNNILNSVTDIPAVKSTMETLNEISYEGLKTSVQGYIDSFTNSITNIPGVKSTLETLNSISYDSLKTSVQGYVDSFTNSVINIPGVKTTLETLNDVSYDSLLTTIQGYVDSFSNSINDIPIVKSTMETLNEVSYESLKTSIQGYVTKFSDSIKDIPLVKSTISTIDTIRFPSLLSAIGDVSSALEGLVSTAKSVYNKVVDYINNAKEKTNSSSVSGKSGVTSSGGSGTGEQNVKINTQNNYNSTKSTSGFTF